MAGEFVFWGHIAFILAAMSIGFFLPLSLVVLFVVAHRLHMVLFDGCFFTRLKQELNMMPRHMDFLSFASVKLFGKSLSNRAASYLDYSFASFPVLIALTRHAF